MRCRHANAFLPLFVLALAVSGCARREEDPESYPADADTSENAGATEAAPPPVLDGVEVEVALTNAAASLLQAASGRISVEATFVGDPVDGDLTHANELGVVVLGNSRSELPGPGRVAFAEELIDRSRLGLISGQPQIMINTTASGSSVPPGLLACSYYWETLSVAGEQPVRITCDAPSGNE